MSPIMQAFWFGFLSAAALTLIGVSVASANRRDDRCAACRATDYMVDYHPAPMDFEDVLRLHGSEGANLPREVDAMMGTEVYAPTDCVDAGCLQRTWQAERCKAERWHCDASECQCRKLPEGRLVA